MNAAEPLPKRVVVESPLAGDFEKNQWYAILCCVDCLNRGEAPYASHLFFHRKGLLNDAKPEEREKGVKAGFAWGAAGELRAFYEDLGLSPGMARGLAEAKRLGQAHEKRTLPKELWEAFLAGPPPDEDEE